MEKKKYLVRLVAGAAALCVSAAVVAPSPAGAQSATGVGTSTAEHVLLSVAIGDLLGVDLFSNKAKATIDSNREPSSAFSRLEPLTVRSSLLPQPFTVAPMESRTPGGSGSVSGGPTDLGAGGLLGLPSLPLTTGALSPATLTSALDELGARSALDAGLGNFGALANLLQVGTVSDRLRTAASLSSSDGTRSLELDAIGLGSLADLLAGLGINLADLPVRLISQLADLLDVEVNTLGGASVIDAVDGLGAAIGGLTAELTKSPDLGDDIVNTVSSVTTVLTGLEKEVSKVLSNGALVSTTTLANQTVQGALTTLRDTLTKLIADLLGAVANTPLLKVAGANVGVSTKAAGTLADSAANVTATVGGVEVLGLKLLGGTDLLQITSLVNQQLKTVLGLLDPLLGEVVKVGLMEKNTSVAADGVYINALAGLNLLSVKVTPPPLLAELVTKLTGATGLSSIGTLSRAGVANPAGSLPLLGGNMLNLGNLLNLPATVGALTKGLSLKVGVMQSASQFRLASAPSAAVAAPAPAPGATLPRTGGDTGTLGILAAGMAALALGVRRWARRPETD